VNSQGLFEDKDFTTSNAITWRGYNAGRLNRAVSSATWRRISQISGAGELFGKLSEHDCRQGQLGNCWFQAGMSAISERQDLLDKIFITKKKNKAGIYCVKMYPMGVEQEVCVDDKIAVYKNNPN